MIRKKLTYIILIKTTNKRLTKEINGCFVKICDVVDLKNKLKELIRAPELMRRLGNQLQQDVITNYSVEKVADTMIRDIFREE